VRPRGGGRPPPPPRPPPALVCWRPLPPRASRPALTLGGGLGGEVGEEGEDVFAVAADEGGADAADREELVGVGGALAQ
jgi:hypothetical protein